MYKISTSQIATAIRDLLGQPKITQLLPCRAAVNFKANMKFNNRIVLLYSLQHCVGQVNVHSGNQSLKPLQEILDPPLSCSVRNRVNPSDNDWLKLLWTDWFENLSDKFTLKQIVKMTVQSEKS